MAFAAEKCPGGHPIFLYTKKIPAAGPGSADEVATAPEGGLAPGPPARAGAGGVDTRVRWCKKCKATFGGDTCPGGYVS